MVVLCVGVLLLLTTGFGQNPVEAASNTTINFQARLMNATGNTVADGNYNVEFKIYNAASSSGSSQGSCSGDSACLWAETRTTTNKVRVENGYLTANLGSVTTFASTINWDQELWLTMNVGGTGAATWDGEMTPRLKLTAVPYAFRAAQLARLAGSNTAVLEFASSFGQGTTITLPDPGATTATVCYQNAASCGFALSSGAGNYIQNQNASAQTTANFWISGTGRADTALQSPIIRATTDGTTAIQVRNAAGSSTVLSVDTTNSRVAIGNGGTAFAPQETVDVIGNLQVRDASTTTKSYRFRTTGSGLDMEGSGAALVLSNWSGAGFTGTQRNYLTLEHAAHVAQATGAWQFRTVDGNTVRHTIDGTAGTSVTFNQSAEATNFSVQGDTDANTFFVQGSTDRVGIGTNTPGNKLDVVGTFGASGNVTVGGTYNTNTFSSSSLQFGAAGTATVQSAASQALTITGHAASTWSTDSGALTVQGASGLNLKATSGNIVLGTSDTSATLLVLDVKTDAGDPGATVEGAMYYNDSSNKFRCYQNTGWTDCIGAGGSTTLQAAYDSSTGSTTPEIKLDSTRGGVDIQDANSTIGTSTPLFTVRGSNGSGLGSELLTVTGNGNVGIGIAAPSRKLDISVNNTTVNALPLIIQQAGTGDTGLEVKNTAVSYYLGIDSSDASKFKITSSSAGGGTAVFGDNTAGGSVDSSNRNFINATKFTASSSGTISTLFASVGGTIGTSPNNQAQMGIYTDSSGSPGTLLRSSSSVSVTSGWNSFSISPTSITSGVTYWLAYNVNGTSDSHNNLNYEAGSSNQSKWVSQTFGTWPGTWSGGTFSSSQMSLYGVIDITNTSDHLDTGLFELTAGGQALFQNNSDSTSAFQIQKASGAQMLTVDTTNNRVIIGNDPSLAGAQAKLYFGDQANANSPWIGESGSSDTDILQLQGRQGMYFSTGGSATVGMSIDSSGNVGIGTSDASRPLHISTNNSTTDAPTLLVEQSGTGDTSIELKDANGKRFFVGMDASAGGAFKIASSTSASTSFETGEDEEGGTHLSNMGGEVIAKKVTTSSSGGSLSSISLYVNAVDGVNPGAKVALYAHDAVNDRPGALLGSTSSSTSLTADSWNTIPVSATVSASTTYWIAVNFQGNGTEINYDYCAGCAGRSVGFTKTFGSAWPDPGSVPWFTSNDENYSFYFTATSAGVVDSFEGTNLLTMSDTGATTFRNSTDSTAAFQVQNSAGNSFFNIDTANSKLSVLDSSGNSLFEIKDVTTADNNFGAIVTSGAFISNTSYFGDEFNTEKNTTALTADQVCVRSGTVNMLCPGDNGQFYFDTTSTTATYSTPADTVNGIARLQFGTTSAVGAFMGNGLTQNNLHAIFLKANLPVVQMKLRTNIVNANNDIVWGLMDQATAPTAQNTLPSNGIFFWPNNGSSWVGVVRSGGSNVGTVTCTGSISTSQFAVGRIEVVGASSVRFLMDYDASNGISFTDCGTVSGANPTAAMGVAVYNIHNETTGSRNIDIDYIRVWQDDAASTDTVSADDLQGGHESDAETGEGSGGSDVLQAAVTTIAQPYDATDNGELGEYYPTADAASFESGDLVAVDENGKAMVRKTKEAYDNKLIGVVSTSSALTIGQAAGEGRSVRVAFTGRAPVKVSTENGPIYPGDLLTASSQPGVAMKATAGGAIIGQALDAFSETGVGRIVVRLNITGHRTGVDAALQNGSFDQLALESITISGNLLVSGDATFNGNVTVQGMEVKGHIRLGSDAAGTLTIPAGQTSAAVRFSKSYEYIPIVTTGTTEFILTRVFNKTVNGFTVGIQNAIPQDLRVDWTAVEPTRSLD